MLVHFSRRLFENPFVVLTLFPGLLLLVGCGRETPPREVVVYTALDQEFSRPIFDAFTRETNIVVRAKYDTESTKTVGLANAILAEESQPRCDVFWNNEVLHTLRLQQAGVLRPVAPAAAADYPPEAKSPDNLWHGFAARARVLLVNDNLVKQARRPQSIKDIVDPQWYDRVGVAKPLFGTTATHAACLFVAWGEEEATTFFQGVKRNARIMAGNRQVARAVASGELMFGLTDTDDAMLEVESGRPVSIVYPDQGDEAMGVLFIPNTLALIRGGPNPQPAEALIEFLLSPRVEGRLVMGPSAQAPLNRRTTAQARIETPSTIKPMKVDFAQAAAAWPEVSEMLLAEFTAAE